jgi:multidrug efflux pump subunit AcrA (membrane-fusion protein)
VVDGPVVHARSVQVGISDGSYIEILSGLKPGDLCVIVGSQLLNDGSAVRVTRTTG